MNKNWNKRLQQNEGNRVNIHRVTDIMAAITQSDRQQRGERKLLLSTQAVIRSVGCSIKFKRQKKEMIVMTMP